MFWEQLLLAIGTMSFSYILSESAFYAANKLGKRGKFKFLVAILVFVYYFSALASLFVGLFMYFQKEDKKKENNLLFDNLVLGFVDGLYYSDIRFYCSDFEMRRYVRDHLAAAHKFPENKHYFEHTTPNGYRYCSRLIPGEHQLFALLCLAQYAKEYDHSQLLSWCETKMNDASHAWSSWRNN